MPVLSYVQAGAFTSTEQLHEGGDFEYILTTTELSERSFALRIRGDSMEPEFKEGDIVIIDTDVYPTLANLLRHAMVAMKQRSKSTAR